MEKEYASSTLSAVPAVVCSSSSAVCVCVCACVCVCVCDMLHHYSKYRALPASSVLIPLQGGSVSLGLGAVSSSLTNSSLCGGLLGSVLNVQFSPSLPPPPQCSPSLPILPTATYPGDEG